MSTAFNPHSRLSKSTASIIKPKEMSKDLDAWNTQDSESDLHREPDRDQLLTRCKDAIESLHEELQDERRQKHLL